MTVLRWLAAGSAGLAILVVGMLIRQNQSLRLQVEQLTIQQHASDTAMEAASHKKQEAEKAQEQKEERIDEASRDNPDFYDQLLPESVLRLLRQDTPAGSDVQSSGSPARGH